MPQDPRQRDGCRFTAQNITAAQEKNPFAKISDIVYELLEKAIFSSAIPPGSKLNISKLADHRIEKVEDACKVGDMMWVKVTDIDEKGRVNLSHKDAVKEIKAKEAAGERIK